MKVTEVTLSLDTSAYSDGDILADTQEVAHAISHGRAILQSLVLLDKDDQGGALDLVFLRNDMELGTENTALNILDADAEEIIGVVEIIAADYVDLINSQIVVKTDIGLLLEIATGSSLYIAAISRDTKTYTAAGLVLKVGLA